MYLSKVVPEIDWAVVVTTVRGLRILESRVDSVPTDGKALLHCELRALLEKIHGAMDAFMMMHHRAQRCEGCGDCALKQFANPHNMLHVNGIYVDAVELIHRIMNRKNRLFKVDPTGNALEM